MQLLHSSSFCYYGGVFEKEALFSFFYCFCGNCFDECLCDEKEAGVCINVKNFILFYLLRLLWSKESTVLGGIFEETMDKVYDDWGWSSSLLYISEQF